LKPRARRIVLAAFASAAAAAACSLDLDESKIPGDGPADAAPIDAPAVDTGPASDGAPGSVYISCKATSDCGAAPNACVTPRCDTARGVCVYDECGSTPGSCTSTTCDPASLTCGASLSTYHFYVGSIALRPGPIGCSGAVGRCFAASFPFVFVGTAAGIVVYPVANPVGATPPPIPIDGVDFPPVWIVASGARVWFLGNKVVSGQTYKLPVAWLDVPTDPTVKRMTANSTTVQTSQQDVGAVRPGAAGSILVTLNDSTQPTTRLAPPLVPDTQVSFYPLGLSQQSSPVTTSGDRIIGLRVATAAAGLPWRPFLTIVSGAGTSNTQSLGEVELTPFNLAAGYGPFSATGPTGGVVLAGKMNQDDPDAGPPGPRAGRLAWVLDDGAGQATSGATRVEYQSFDPAVGNVVGPIAWIDPTTALVTSTGSTDAGLVTTVQGVTRATKPPSVLPGSHALPGNANSYAYAGSQGFGYALGVDGTSGTPQPTVYMFAPTCK